MPEDHPPQDENALPAVIRLGSCEIRRDTRELLVHGEVRQVRRRVFDLIVYLVRHRPRAVPHHELLRALWQRSEASPSLLARAVMEARQALDDVAEQPQYIVSVHGVGYRYAGVVDTPGAATTSAARPGDVDPVAQEAAALHDLIQRARTAGFECRYEQALRMADEAITRADVLGSHAEKARAMLVRGSSSMHLGQLPEAARFYAGALRIARAEGHDALVAEARMCTGGLHVVAGNLEMAMGHLREAMAVFSQPGHEVDLVRCLTWMAHALSRAGDFGAALQTCRRSLQVYARHPGPQSAAIGRMNEAWYLVQIGDRSAALGETARAAAAHEEALAINAELLAGLDVPEHRTMYLAALAARAMLLERLGRLEEAWRMTQAYDDALGQTPAEVAREGLGLGPLIRIERARLLSRLGRTADAMAQAREALEMAAKLDLLLSDVEELYRAAAGIAERAGELATALQWLRAGNEQLARMQRGGAASLAALLAAEMNSDELQAQNDALLAQQRELVQESAELKRRLQALEGTVPVDPHTGMAASALLEAALAPAHAHAQSRGLPMCVALLSLRNAAELHRLHGPRAVEDLCRQVGETLGASGDVALPAIDMGHGRVAFRIRNAGLARAQQVCRELEADLRRRTGRDGAVAPPPQWHCVTGNAVQHASVRACVEQLMAG